MELVGAFAPLCSMSQTGNVAGEEFKQQYLLCPVASVQIWPIKTS